MEYSMDCVTTILQQLAWKSNGAPEDIDEEDTEAVIKPIAIKKLNTIKWLKRSRKSVVRMIAAYVYCNYGSKSGKRKKFIDRSLVRMIGSKLPLQPSKRAYFEIFFESNRAIMSKAKTFVEENLNHMKSHMPEMGLADVALFSWDGFDAQQTSRKDIVTRSTLDSSGLSLSHISEISQEDCALPPRCVQKGKMLRKKGTSEKKISALEDELANLRAQIAMIVSAQEKPKAMEHAVPLPPPPPPICAPLPPPLLVIQKPSQTQNKKVRPEKTADVPSMRDVLVGLSAIKLKSSNMQRSPGGTPLKVKSINISESSNDPADIIANALRKKFAKARRSITSPPAGKENQTSPHSGFSPTPPSTPDGSPITSSPHKDGQRRSRRRSSALNGKTIILSPVNEN